MSRRVRRLVLAGLVLAGCGGGEPGEYDEEFAADFLEQCTDAYGRPGGDQVCGCWYDTVQERVPFDELPDVDDMVGDDFDIAPTRLPGGELDIPLESLAACVRRLGAEPGLGEPVPLPTTPRPPRPPTTTTTVPV